MQSAGFLFSNVTLSFPRLPQNRIVLMKYNELHFLPQFPSCGPPCHANATSAAVLQWLRATRKHNTHAIPGTTRRLLSEAGYSQVQVCLFCVLCLSSSPPTLCVVFLPRHTGLCKLTSMRSSFILPSPPS